MDAVLLHGFGGTPRTGARRVAQPAAERYLAPDLRGHGAARHVRPITFEGCVTDVLEAAPPRFTLCGYSMGGRIALHVALEAPERLSRLVLVATTAGLDTERERAERRAADEEQARRLEAEGVDAWGSQPLFAGEPPDVAEEARADRARNDPHALAAALRGIGTGAMAPLWDRLGELRMPAVVLAGERDTKFTALGQRLSEALGNAGFLVVAGAGHRVHLEAPEAVAQALSD